MPIRSEIIQPKHASMTFAFQVNPESCDNHEHYEHYLRFSALTDQAEGKRVTHIFIESDESSGIDCIVGFVTLRTTSLIAKFDEYTSGYSSIEIAELAVDKQHEGDGIGTQLVNHAIVTALQLSSEHVGVEYIILCADHKAVEFYSNPNFGFEPKVGFEKLNDLIKEIPRDSYNASCEPMILKLH